MKDSPAASPLTGKAIYNASRWIALSTLVRQTLHVLQILILARLLEPNDFGQLAIILSFMTILGTISDGGVNKAIISFPRPSATELSSLYWINIIFSCAAGLMLAATSPIVANIYKDQSLTLLLCVASLNLPLIAIGQQLKTLSEKYIDFRPITVIETIATLLGFGLTLTLCLFDQGVLSIVMGMLLASLTSSSLLWTTLKLTYRPRFHLRLKETYPYLKFGAYSIAESIANTIHTQADVLIAGVFASSKHLGFFSVSRDISLRVSNQLTNPIITRLSLPLMARSQSDKSTVRAIYLDSIRMSTSINLPIYMAIALLSDDIVHLLLGERWGGAEYYLRLFAIWGAIRSIGNPVGSLVYAMGKARLAFVWNIAMLILIPATYWVSVLHGGIKSLLAAMITVQVVIFFAMWRYLIRPTAQISLKSYTRSIYPALATSSICTATMWAVLYPVDTAFLRLLIGGTAGALLYFVLSYYLNPGWLRMMRKAAGL